jgi:hypothetical protein
MTPDFVLILVQAVVHAWGFCSGAFVHRHCRELGLPLSIATPAAHIALARVFNSRSNPMRATELSLMKNRVEALQKAPVFLAIALVCKHVLRTEAVQSDMVCCLPCLIGHPCFKTSPSSSGRA